jgi:hypothetical protein
MIAPLSLSACLRTPVWDSGGRAVGRLADLEAEPGERFPRVSALLVRRRRAIERVPWKSVERLGTGVTLLRARTEAAVPTCLLRRSSAGVGAIRCPRLSV